MLDGPGRDTGWYSQHFFPPKGLDRTTEPQAVPSFLGLCPRQGLCKPKTLRYLLNAGFVSDSYSVSRLAHRTTEWGPEKRRERTFPHEA